MTQNPYGSQTSAYAQTNATGENLRDTEARALINCARRLEQAQQASTSYRDYCAALKRNQELWTIFQAAISDGTSGLPHELRQILYNLSIFVDKQTVKAIGDHNPQYLDSLININRNIAAGLNQKPPAENKAPQAAEKSAIATQAPPSLSGGSLSV